MKRETPAGTWPMLVALGLALVITPAILLRMVVPEWLATIGAWAYLAAAVGSLGWSWAVFVRTRDTSARGVPIIGVVFGVVVVCLGVLLLLLPRID